LALKVREGGGGQITLPSKNRLEKIAAFTTRH